MTFTQCRSRYWRGVDSARVSAGEHDLSYYRYDGKAYRPVYAYSSEFVGSDANGNDLLIARGGAKTRVVCR